MSAHGDVPRPPVVQDDEPDLVSDLLLVDELDERRRIGRALVARDRAKGSSVANPTCILVIRERKVGWPPG